MTSEREHCIYLVRAWLPGNEQAPEPDAVYSGRHMSLHGQHVEVAPNGLLVGGRPNYTAPDGRCYYIGSGRLWASWRRKHRPARVEAVIVARFATEQAMLRYEHNLITLTKRCCGARCKNLTTSARGFDTATARMANAKLSPEQRLVSTRKAATARWAGMTPEERRVFARRGRESRRRLPDGRLACAVAAGQASAASKTPEQLREWGHANASKGNAARWADTTREQRVEATRRALVASMTPEVVAKRTASLLTNTTPEQRSGAARKAAASRLAKMTPEQRREWGRRITDARIAKRMAQQRSATT